MKTIIKAILVFLIACSPALADRLNRTVPANKPTVVNALGVFNTRSCEFGPLPRPKIIQAPKYGKVVTKRTISTINKGTCKGKKIKSTNVIYIPNRGFRGKDSFRTRFSYDAYAAGSALRFVDDHYIVTVK